jgi:hypothetical protein
LSCQLWSDKGQIKGHLQPYQMDSKLQNKLNS